MWKEIILLAAFIIVAVFVFIRLSSIKVGRRKLVSLPTRLIISLFFPVIALVIILLGSFLLVLVFSLVVLFVLLLFILFLFSRPKVYYYKKKF